MQTINSETRLRNAILELESKQAEEMILLREQFHLTYESIKPVNLILGTLKEVSESQALKNGFLNTSVGLVSGYISKVIFEGKSHNPLRKMMGTALMFGITNAITQNPETIKLVGKVFLKMISGSSSNEAKENAS